MAVDDARALARWLGSPDAQALVADLLMTGAANGATDPLTAAAALRRDHPRLDPVRAAAVLEQADLGRRARGHYGLDPTGLLLSRDGLEAATRPEVAARRARLVADSGARRVLDLTGGLGLDARAFVAAGLAVTAVERDPVTAVRLAHNCPSAEVVEADALAAGPMLVGALGDADVVFVDPARRDATAARHPTTLRARPERDPERWSPPWSFIAGLAHPRVLVKASPGFAPPPGWHAEWVSVERTVVECTVASWPIADRPRQAVVFDRGRVTVVAADERPDLSPAPPPAAGIGRWVHESDPAVVRAGALAAVARLEGLSPLDPGSTWLTGDGPAGIPALRSYEVVSVLRGSDRDQRRQLEELGVRRLTVKSRDARATPATLLASLRLREGPEHVLVVTRHAGRSVRILCRPAVTRGS